MARTILAWPLELNITDEGLAAVAQAIEYYLGNLYNIGKAAPPDDHPPEVLAELQNVVNHITSHLERPPTVDDYKPPECPTPQKQRYYHEAQAAINAMKWKQHVYKCECGYFHLSKLAPGMFTDKINSPAASADEFPDPTPTLEDLLK
jgi:hypothetical protein